ncbi:MAG: SDR family oxidoreductase [Rhodocyclaceae bacterium]|nr:SDR family oxidoreductase [Rhodocyclaceae bacterium]
MNTVEFAGKAIAVTGAASGLGRAASIRFANEGGKLCLIDLNQRGLEETAASITGAGGECVIVAGDLGEPANCKVAVAAAIEAFGRLDVLCNVAGILRFHALEQVTPADWDRLFSANVSSAFFMMQAAMPHLIEAEGNVVNVVSTASFLGQAYTAPYAATKSALLSLTKSLAMEFMHQPVRINALAPGGMIVCCLSCDRWLKRGTGLYPCQILLLDTDPQMGLVPYQEMERCFFLKRTNWEAI